MSYMDLLKSKPAKVLLTIGFIWTFFDTLLDLKLSLLHGLVVLAHYLFEMLEHGLDSLVEHLFHTSPRTTEIIVFYLMTAMGAAIAYLILRKVPHWYCALCERVGNYWQQEKAKAIAYWQTQSPILKAKWYTICVSLSFIAYFLVLG